MRSLMVMLPLCWLAGCAKPETAPAKTAPDAMAVVAKPVAAMLAAPDAAAAEAPAPSPAPGPASAARAWTPSQSCTADTDCVPMPGCCPAPCTSHVINKKDQARAQAELSCPTPRDCPSAGGCRTHAYLCVKKSCELVYSDSPDYRPRQ